LSGRQNTDVADTQQIRDVAMATTFWLSMTYNFSCMTASDTLFDSRGGFSVTSYPRRHSQDRGSKGRCHDNYLWPPCGIGHAIIFCPVVSFFFYLFSSPNLSDRRMDVYYGVGWGETPTLRHLRCFQT